MEMKRAWINQPSTLQPLHRLHGTQVIAYVEKYHLVSRVWFLSGTVISMNVPTIVLSMGWREF